MFNLQVNVTDAPAKRSQRAGSNVLPTRCVRYLLTPSCGWHPLMCTWWRVESPRTSEDWLIWSMLSIPVVSSSWRWMWEDFWRESGIKCGELMSTMSWFVMWAASSRDLISIKVSSKTTAQAVRLKCRTLGSKWRWTRKWSFLWLHQTPRLL